MFNNQEILVDALMGMADIINETLVATICQSALLSRLREIANIEFRNIQVPLLRVLAFITNGTDNQTQQVIDSGFLDLFFEKFLTNEK